MPLRYNIDREENDEAVREMLKPQVGRVGQGPAIDPETGEVSGTGSGTGGGNAGEDYDTDHTAGSNTAK